MYNEIIQITTRQSVRLIEEYVREGRMQTADAVFFLLFFFQ